MKITDNRAERFTGLKPLPGETEQRRDLTDYMPRATGRFADADGVSYKPLVILGIITAGLAAVTIAIMYMA